MGILYALLAAQALLYRVILKGYLRWAGTWPDSGSNFLAYWVLVVLPMCALVGIGAALWRRRRSGSSSQMEFFIAVSAIDLVALLGSFVVYARWLHR